jgi:hypothetical protein
MSSGFVIADKFNLKEQTNVVLEYSQTDNCFKVHFQSDEQFFNLPTIEHFDRYSETISAEEINIINQIDFNRNAIYTWSRKITPAIARIKKTQILVKFLYIYIIILIIISILFTITNILILFNFFSTVYPKRCCHHGNVRSKLSYHQKSHDSKFNQM